MSRRGQINRVKHVLDMDTLTIVVNSVVFSKLFYCSYVWINTTESNLDKVQKVQNFACRIISGVKKFDYITPVLRWLPIRQQLYYRNAVIAFNCVTGCAPDNSDSLTDQFIKRSDVSTSTTRSLKKLQIPFLKSATGKRSLYYRTVRIWNALDPLLKLGSTLQESKQKLQSILLIKRLYRQYSVIYLCNILYRLDYTAFLDSKLFFFFILSLIMYSLKGLSVAPRESTF